MAEEKLVIKVGDYDVLSELVHDPARNLYVVTSTCGDHTQKNAISVLESVTYSSEQLEYDLEQWRHKMANAVAGKAHIKTLLPGAIKSVGDDVPVVTGGPRFKKPPPAAAT